MSAKKESSAPAPPSYQEATSTGASKASTKPSHLEVPGAHNDIPDAARRSMEDEQRSLPEGWIRQFDANQHHQFFVDTRADPPRSIWHHPYDDEEYLSTLTSEEREAIQDEENSRRRPLTPSSVDEKHFPDSKETKPSTSPQAHFPSDLPDRTTRPSVSDSGRKKSVGERLKNKVTGTTREERERDRAKRAQQEREYGICHETIQRTESTDGVSGIMKLTKSSARRLQEPNRPVSPNSSLKTKRERMW